jgi:hypothetical protein
MLTLGTWCVLLVYLDILSIWKITHFDLSIFMVKIIPPNNLTYHCRVHNFL